MQNLAQTPLTDLDLKETERPKMQPLANANDTVRRKGRHLAAVHRHYLSEMKQIATVLERIKAGEQPTDALRDIILHSDMRKNFEMAGTICGHQCRVLTMHHDIEEHSMFPVLASQGHAALTKVVEKLRAEHLVIHELLTRLSACGEVLVNDPGATYFEDAYAVFCKLRCSVESHFGYEETQLEESIGLYLGGI